MKHVYNITTSKEEFSLEVVFEVEVVVSLELNKNYQQKGNELYSRITKCKLQVLRDGSNRHCSACSNILGELNGQLQSFDRALIVAEIPKKLRNILLSQHSLKTATNGGL